ncbi:MAG: antitoxin [Luteococcus japonicus]
MRGAASLTQVGEALRHEHNAAPNTAECPCLCLLPPWTKDLPTGAWSPTSGVAHGIFDKVKEVINGGEGSLANKARDAANSHEVQVDQGIDKAGDFVDGKTDAKYADKVQDFLKDETGNL